MKDTSVILLAAGASSRMGQPKLALPFGGRTALEHALLAFLQVEDSPVAGDHPGGFPPDPGPGCWG